MTIKIGCIIYINILMNFCYPVDNNFVNNHLVNFSVFHVVLIFKWCILEYSLHIVKEKSEIRVTYELMGEKLI